MCNYKESDANQSTVTNVPSSSKRSACWKIPGKACNCRLSLSSSCKYCGELLCGGELWCTPDLESPDELADGCWILLVILDERNARECSLDSSALFTLLARTSTFSSAPWSIILRTRNRMSYCVRRSHTTKLADCCRFRCVKETWNCAPLHTSVTLLPDFIWIPL